MRIKDMSLYLTNPFPIPLDKANDHEYLTAKLRSLLRAHRKDFLSYSLYKRSIDARDKSNVHFVCSYVVNCSSPPQNATPYQEPADVFENAGVVSSRDSCVVVGAGPAGLFAALYLCKCGLDVVIVERGRDVIPRKQAVDEFFNGGQFNPNTNIQFGLGGAGTFSDGKLTSNLSGTSLGRSVFNMFVNCGAPCEILYNAMPHIGTDNLVNVVAALRNAIVNCGGKFMFDAQVVDLVLNGDNVEGVAVKQNGTTFNISAQYTILACGHSARDTFEMLSQRGAKMQFKPFAVGLRVEHTREFINTAQYGKLFATHRDLSSATYKLTHKCADGHGCYSFCMCPGGVVVAANSEYDSVVVNGMSNFDRLALNSNSALVVTVNAQDVCRYGYGQDLFSGVRFQRDLEQKAYMLGGGGYVAPCQNVTDFLQNRVSSQFDVIPSYPMGVKSCNLRELLPTDLANNLAEALTAFNRKIQGFGASGVLVGVETRTSSPIRIMRDDNFQSNLKRLYPIGEGAGYAGGIVSSAVDGLRAAMSIVKSIRDVK